MALREGDLTAEEAEQIQRDMGEIEEYLYLVSTNDQTHCLRLG